jgi:hypothetical protein
LFVEVTTTSRGCTATAQLPSIQLIEFMRVPGRKNDTHEQKIQSVRVRGMPNTFDPSTSSNAMSLLCPYIYIYIS